MKRGVTCVLGVVGAFGLASTAMADTVTFRAADIHPDGYPTVEAVIYMGKLVEVGPTETIFTRPTCQQTEDYVTGRFG